MISIPEIFGRFLIVLGAIGFMTSAILGFTDYSGLDEGALPAASFFIILVGMVFHFPTLLQEAKGEVSTMRVIVFAVVMVFAVVHLKIGWNAGTFKDFQIDNTWVYIIGLAFGSKVFQKFNEEEKKNPDQNRSDPNK
ncbi:MAG: hypothetical protein ABL895_19420 [Cyclobacteriaceae bacterium]